MASKHSIDYGWFFLRVSMGLYFLQLGAAQFNINNIDFRALALILAGAALITGLLVRPGVLLLLASVVTIFVSGSRIELKLIRNSIVELLAIIGFLFGGGGTFLAIGAALQGLKGKWYQ